MVDRHSRQLKSAIESAQAARKQAARAAEDALNASAGEALAATLAAARRAVQDQRASDMLDPVLVFTSSPSGVGAELERAQETARLSGQRRQTVLVLVPRPHTRDHQERRACLLTECSEDVWRGLEDDHAS